MVHPLHPMLTVPTGRESGGAGSGSSVADRRGEGDLQDVEDVDARIELSCHVGDDLPMTPLGFPLDAEHGDVARSCVLHQALERRLRTVGQQLAHPAPPGFTVPDPKGTAIVGRVAEGGVVPIADAGRFETGAQGPLGEAGLAADRVEANVDDQLHLRRDEVLDETIEVEAFVADAGDAAGHRMMLARVRHAGKGGAHKLEARAGQLGAPARQAATFGRRRSDVDGEQCRPSWSQR